MHELGVVFHIMDSLESVAKENDVTQIQSVTIEIGEVSTVIPHYLTDFNGHALELGDIIFFGNLFQRVDNVKHNTQLVHITSPSSWRT